MHLGSSLDRFDNSKKKTIFEARSQNSEPGNRSEHRPRVVSRVQKLPQNVVGPHAGP